MPAAGGERPGSSLNHTTVWHGGMYKDGCCSGRGAATPFQAGEQTFGPPRQQQLCRLTGQDSKLADPVSFGIPGHLGGGAAYALLPYKPEHIQTAIV
jgi:hypothetical protein